MRIASKSGVSVFSPVYLIISLIPSSRDCGLRIADCGLRIGEEPPAFQSAIRNPQPAIALGLLPVAAAQLDVEAERLQFAHKHVERFGQAGLEVGLALDDGLVNPRASGHVVRFRRQQLLQDVRRAVSFERPDLHFAEALAAELRLAAERLLCDQAVRADRARVNLVVHQVREFEHVYVPHGHLLLERLARHAVVEDGLARIVDHLWRSVGPQLAVGLLQETLDLGLGRAVEDGRGETQAEHVRVPAQMRLENLADVHARRHSERVENDLDRSPVGQIRHVLFGQDARDDALVPVAPGHLVADRQLAFHGDEDLNHLDHARRQLVALLDLVYLLLIEVFENGDLAFGALFEVLDLGGDVARAADLDPLERADVHAFQHFSRQLGAFDGDGARAEDQVGFELAPFEQFVDALVALLFEDADFVGQVLPHLLLFGGLDREAADVLVLTLAGENLDVDDGALDARRAGQGRVAHVAGLLAEDRAEQFLLGGQLSLALRRDLADQDRAGLDVGADADDAALVEVSQRGLADVRDVARDLFGAELGVAGLDLELLDVD